MRQHIAFISGCATVMTVVGFANGASLNQVGGGTISTPTRPVVREGSVRLRGYSFVISTGAEQYTVPVPASASVSAAEEVGTVDFDLALDSFIDADMAADLAKLRRQVGATSEGQIATLRELRLQAGLSQKDMADRLMTGQAYISRLERGEIKDPSISRADEIAEALGVDVTKVLSAFRVLRSEGKDV